MTSRFPLHLDRLPEVAAALAAHAAEHDQYGSFPFEGVEAVHSAGLLTATVSVEYGGPGAGLADTVTILRALGAADPSVALITAMTLFTHAAQARQPGWPARYYAELLDDSAAGPSLVNAVRVEPELGTPARGGLPATTATRSGDGWLLNGHKINSTGAVGLRWFAVWARTDEPGVESGTGSAAETAAEPRVGSFLLRADKPGEVPGLTIEPTWDHLGLRASRSDDVLLRDVRVPLDATAGLAAPGAPDPRRDANAVAWNNLGLTALYLGVAESARDWLTGFLKERTPSALGRPLATLPRFQAEVGEIEAELIGAVELVQSLARRYDAGDPDAGHRAAAAKLLGTRAAADAVQRAVALVGNNALTRRNPLERHWRDVQCARVHTPQDDTVLAQLGSAALG